MKVAVIGLGYVGLTLSLAASKHYQVVGFDVDVNKIRNLEAGFSYIEDVSNSELKSAITRNLFIPTSNTLDLADSDIFIICVPTPLTKERRPDLSYIESATDIIAEVSLKNALIINESTSYPGTLRELIKARIESRSHLKHKYAAAPERIDPGRKNFNALNTPRILSGIDLASTEAALEFYSRFCDNLNVVESPEIAETAKLFENTFRQVNIALVNELAVICNALRLDVYSVLSAAETKPYGFMKFIPGPGVGGHCIPVDPTYLSYAAETVGVSANFINLANSVNLGMPNYILNRCLEILGTLKSKKVLIFGVSYKSNIADTRETPAELIYKLFSSNGAQVNWFDPLVEDWLPGKVNIEDLKDFDLAVLQVLHDVMNVELISGSAKYIFDCTGKFARAHHI